MSLAQLNRKLKKPKTITDEEVLDVLSSESIIEGLDGLISNFGVDVLKAWRLNSKHKHALVHELVRRKKGPALKYLVKAHQFDINVPRESDQCTPLHLSGWTKQPELMKLLVDLGADTTLENKYGEDGSKVLAISIKSENLVWLDLELTNLAEDGPVGDAILECALVITNKDLTELSRQSWVISHSEEVLGSLSPWHQKNFCEEEKGGNGLFADVLASKTTKAAVEEAILSLLGEHCPEGMCRLAGSSVHCDRAVLFHAMPKVHKFLHHQIIDASTVSNLVKMWNPELAAQIPPMTGYNHRAMSDIDASIAHLKWFRTNLFNQQ